MNYSKKIICSLIALTLIFTSVAYGSKSVHADSSKGKTLTLSQAFKKAGWWFEIETPMDDNDEEYVPYDGDAEIYKAFYFDGKGKVTIYDYLSYDYSFSSDTKLKDVVGLSDKKIEKKMKKANKAGFKKFKENQLLTKNEKARKLAKKLKYKEPKKQNYYIFFSVSMDKVDDVELLYGSPKDLQRREIAMAEDPEVANRVRVSTPLGDIADKIKIKKSTLGGYRSFPCTLLTVIKDENTNFVYDEANAKGGNIRSCDAFDSWKERKELVQKLTDQIEKYYTLK